MRTPGNWHPLSLLSLGVMWIARHLEARRDRLVRKENLEIQRAAQLIADCDLLDKDRRLHR